jgi:general secretion pathway protein B
VALRIYALHELPDPVRRSIPPLVVNGSVYSRNPADRFLIVNGQIVHESDSVAPGIVIEAIGQRAAVLNTLGHRFEISY